MINRIIAFSIKNKFAVGLFILILIVYGIYSVSRLPIDAVPDITNNQVQVITISPTLATQEVEQFITTPMEIEMATIADVTEIRSLSRFGLSVITVVFKDKVDKYLARQLVNERMKEAEKNIPEGLGEAQLAPITTGLGEIYQYTIHAKPGYENKYSAMDLRTIQDWVVRRRLLGTPGVADVSGWGGELKQYEIAIDPYKLKSMQISFSEIFSALKNNNENTGGAYIEKSTGIYLIRGMGLVTSLDDIKNIVVKNINGVPVLINDLAQVQYGSAIRYGAVTRNGEGEVVGGVVLMLKGENTSEVIANVKDKIAQIQKSLPEGVALEPYIDRTNLIDRSISTVSKNLMMGFLIVVFVLILFLGNFRAALIVAFMIPLAMLFAVIMMNIFGVTGNLMSLGAIDFGIIVDGAVIIVESVVHRIFLSRHHHVGIAKLDRQQMNTEVSSGISQVIHSSSFGQIIILIVYLPILALVGVEGKMFTPMAQTVSFAILGAFLLSITYLPMATSLFLSRKTAHKENFSDKLLKKMHRIYEPVIQFILKNCWQVVTISIVLFILSFFIFKNIGQEFIPTLEEGDLSVEFRLPTGTSLTQTIAYCTQAEKILKDNFPEVRQVVSRIGTSEIPTDPMPIEAGDMIVTLKEKGEWTSADSREELMEKMEKSLSVIPGVGIEIIQPIQMRFNELIAGIRQDVAIKIYGENFDTLATKANQVAKIIAPVKGVETPFIEQTTGLPEITVSYDRTRLAQFGLTISEVNQILKTAFGGDVAGVVFEGEKKFDLVVRLGNNYRKDISDVKSLFISLPSGSQIPLSELATINYKLGPVQISHDNAKRRTFVGFNVRGRDIQSTVKEIQKKLDENLKLPPGYYIEYGGQFQNLEDASKRLSVAVPVALALIFILLFFTFGNITQCILVFSAIPLSAIGGVLALWIAGMPFSISAGIGFIALFGVSVLNGIVLIDYFNQLKQQGVEDIYERVIKGTKGRFRSVIMTGAVPALGFLPMVISTSAGAEVQKPLATVVIGGLITSTALTLIVLPALYVLFSGKKKIKIKGSVAASILCVFFGVASTNVKGQTAKYITLDSALNIALQNNPAVLAKALQIKRNTYLKKTSFDLPKTGIFIENEDKNAIDAEGLLKIGVSQSVEFPTVYIAKGKINNQNVSISKSEYILTQKEIMRDVSAAYYELYYTTRLQALVKNKDSIFSNYETAAKERYASGETNYLESVAAQAKHEEIKLQLQQIKKDVLINQLELMRLLNTQDSVLPDVNSAEKLSEPLVSNFVAEHPFLNYYQQQIQLSEFNKRLAINEVLPDFSVRYFNQNWYGIEDGYKGYSFGVGIPVAFWSYTARIKAAKTDVQIAQKNYLNNSLQFTSAYNTLLQELDKNKTALKYYETTGLQLGNEILNAANESYKAGESGYFEFTSAVEQYFQIQNNYFQSLLDYNQTIIRLNYFLNK